MNDSLFALRLLLSFVVGGAFVTACTIAAERFGTSIGGIIGGFPSTIAVTLLFIALVSGEEAASRTTDVIPFIMGFNGLFIVCFVAFARRGLLVGLASALSVWVVSSTVAIVTNFHSFPISFSIFLLMFFLSYLLLYYGFHLPMGAGGRLNLSMGQIAARATFSGSIIALAVFLSKVSGPIAGGAFCVFPAVFTSTLVIASRARGVEFARVLARPLMVSGLVNVVTYATCVRYLYPTLGLITGTIGAFAVSACSAYATFRFVRSRELR